MDISSDGVAFIARHEDRRNRPYNDTLGHCTVGVGHLLHIGPCTDDELARTYSDAEVDDLLRDDLAWAVDAVNRYVVVPLAQRQFDALVSFAFNWGVGTLSGFPATSVLRLVNEGRFAEASADLVDGRGPATEQWPEGRPYDKGLDGVRSRRRQEAAWLASGAHPVRFVARDEAGLRPARGATALHVDTATAHYGGDSPGVIDDHAQCLAIWRAWQRQHMDTAQLAPGGAVDIAYNLGVCQHGYVVEGRGTGVRSAANGTTEANGASYAIVYLAGSGVALTDAAKDAFNDAADLLGASLDYGHRDWVGTSCPGDELYAWVHDGHPRAGATTEEDDDMFTDDDRRKLDKIERVLVGAPAPGDESDDIDDLRTRLGRIEDQLATLSTGGGSVDVDALAAAVADKLADRLAS